MLNNITREQIFKKLINDIFIGDYSIEIILDGSSKKINFYNSKGELLIEYNQRNKHTIISYNKIWLIFKQYCNMTYDEIELFMSNMLSKHFKIMKTIPMYN